MRTIRLTLAVVSTINTLLVIHFLGQPGASAGPVATENGDCDGSGATAPGDFDWVAGSLFEEQ